MNEVLKVYVIEPVLYGDIYITIDINSLQKGDVLLYDGLGGNYDVIIESCAITKTINNNNFYSYMVNMPKWAEMVEGTQLTLIGHTNKNNTVPPPIIPTTEKPKGLRFNSNKIRMDLVPYSAIEGIAKVLTYGANKYTIKDEEGNIITKGDNNWKLGMPWLDVYASLDRHLGAWLKGEDYDESGELHIDHVLTNAAFIKEYMSIHPEGDNRDHWYNSPIKKVWLDLDGVCFDFEPHFLKWFNLPDHHPTDWNDYRFRDNISSCTDDFWAQCPIIEGSNVLPYPIAGYCTARNCSDEIIKATLDKHGFPAAPIINVGVSGSKVEALKSAGCEVFIDDSINNFTALNAAGILCYLMERPHNLKYDVGSRRCKNLKEFVNKIKLLN
jgi:hypothetical protein